MSAGSAPEVRATDVVNRHWPRLTLEELVPVLRRYPQVGEPREILWHSARPFSSAALLRGAHASVFVKRHAAAVRTRSELEQEHAFIAHLRRKGLPVPEVLGTLDGSTVVYPPGWTYELHRIAPGVDLYREASSWDPFVSRQHAHAAGEALARLHHGSTGYAAPGRDAALLVGSVHLLMAPDLGPALERELAQRPRLRAWLEGKPWERDLLPRVTPWHARFQHEAALLEPLWAHNDWHASNLFWSDGSAQAQVVSILDFGLSNRTHAAYDLVTALERNVVPWLEIQAGRDAAADPVMTAALLAGYVSERPLSPAECRAIPALLPIVHLEFALTEIEYYAGVVDDPEYAELAWSAFLLGHIDWFAGPHGREFLAAVTDCLSVATPGSAGA